MNENKCEGCPKNKTLVSGWCCCMGNHCEIDVRNKTINEIHTKLVNAFNKKYSFNDSHLLEFEVLDIISDTINQMKEQK